MYFPRIEEWLEAYKFRYFPPFSSLFFFHIFIILYSEGLNLWLRGTVLRRHVSLLYTRKLIKKTMRKREPCVNFTVNIPSTAIGQVNVNIRAHVKSCSVEQRGGGS
jgi:hypothetical protein